MKKISIFTVLSILLCSVVYADQLQFVTLMSAPVGSFSKVETVTKAKATNASIYGNTSIQLRGTGNAVLGDVVLEDNAALTGDVGELSANTLTIQSGGNITGKGLWANTVTMDSAADSNVKVKETLYVENGANVSGAAVWGNTESTEDDFVIEGKNKMNLEEERTPGDSLAWRGDEDKTERLLASNWGSSSAQEEELVTWHTCIKYFEYLLLEETSEPNDVCSSQYYLWSFWGYSFHTANTQHCYPGGQFTGIQLLNKVAEKNDQCSPGDKFLYGIVASRDYPVGGDGLPKCSQTRWACAVCGKVTSLDDCASDITLEQVSSAPLGGIGPYTEMDQIDPFVQPQH